MQRICQVACYPVVSAACGNPEGKWVQKWLYFGPRNRLVTHANAHCALYLVRPSPAAVATFVLDVAICENKPRIISKRSEDSSEGLRGAEISDSINSK